MICSSGCGGATGAGGVTGAALLLLRASGLAAPDAASVLLIEGVPAGPGAAGAGVAGAAAAGRIRSSSVTMPSRRNNLSVEKNRISRAPATMVLCG